MGKHKDSLPGGVNSSRVSGSHTPGGRYGYRLEYRRKQAAAQAEARANRTPQQQLVRLDIRFGKGVGAVKERARLAAQIDKPKKAEKSEEKQAKNRNPKGKARNLR
jgi:hypothetical protein